MQILGHSFCALIQCQEFSELHLCHTRWDVHSMKCFSELPPSDVGMGRKSGAVVLPPHPCRTLKLMSYILGLQHFGHP
jgi:hypothetical protein